MGVDVERSGDRTGAALRLLHELHDAGSRDIQDGLIARLSVDAADPQHPAHLYFIERTGRLRALIAEALQGHQAFGEFSARFDPDAISRLFQAVTDGMQIQWMLDPEVDMAATITLLFDALSPPKPA